MNRRAYTEALHAALDQLLHGQRSVVLAEITSALEASFEHPAPAPVTLARVLVHRGWHRIADSKPAAYERIAA